MKTLRALSLVLCLSAASVIGRAQFTGTYDFASTISDVPVVTNVSFTALTGTNTTVTRLSGALASSSNWVINGSSADTSEFLSFSLQANSGYTLDISSLTFKASSSSTGPSSMAIALYVGGVLQETSSTYHPVVTATSTTAAMGSALTFNFSDKTTVVSTSNVQFRIYGWGGTNASGALRLDDISVTGAVNAVSAVPEPATYAALAGAMALLGAMVYRRRARRAALPAAA